MVSKTITITKEAYLRLFGKKRNGESFSEVILRTFQSSTGDDLRKFLGTISKDTADKMKEHIVTQRNKIKEEFDKREHDLFG